MRLLFQATVLVLALAANSAWAQSRARVFDVKLGSPVSALPVDEWVDPACGTNGGPPSLPLESFADFARCPVERATGLREVWFIYDDEWEYIARAQRDEFQIGRWTANMLYRQPIVTSLLIDDAGLVQGYRVTTDPRAPVDVREQSYTLYVVFKGMFEAAPWNCTDLPRGERERDLEGLFLKVACEMAAEDRFVKVEARHLRKPGQDLGQVPRFIEEAAGDFESNARLEVYNRAAVRDAPCCRASARP